MKASLCAWLMVVLAGAAAGAGENAPESREDALARFDFRQVIRAAKDKVFPAVVYIKVVQETHESGKKTSQEIA
ncbi:MAG: hypothetical protein NTU94_12050, partial [Planctomycetota bacterium]|nr:hypothetical protein [Planctomycetota bacterium]